jgi:hypothetical protein
MEPDDMDPQLDGGHAMKKRRTSSARSTVVSPNGQSWDSVQWRQQPQSFDRSSMVIPEEGHSGEQAQDDVTDDSDDDQDYEAEQVNGGGRTQHGDNAHGGIRIVDPSQPVPVPLVRGQRNRRDPAASTNSSYTSPVSVISNIIPNGQGHARNGSMNNAIYSRGVYATPSDGYVAVQVPVSMAPSQPQPNKKGKARSRKSTANASNAASSSASASSQVANGDVWASPGGEGSQVQMDDGVRHQKPNFTYHELITHEIKRSPDGRLQLSEIYKRISQRYPYFKLGDPGWQNSIRHNLSLKSVAT